MVRRYLLLTLLGLSIFLGCKAISQKTPVCYKKPPHVFRTTQGEQASRFFWSAFQSANYAQSDQSLALLTQAAQSDPTDTHLVSLVGLCSFWKVLEHQRGGLSSAATYPLAVQSLNYVEEAARREPQNRLTPGFVSSAKYQLGAMEGDHGKMCQATAELQTNTNIYPQFHGFVEGWVLTAMLPPSHPAFERGVEAYYETLDSCAGIRVPRAFPKIGEVGIFILAKRSAKETVCYNTDIAPHNLEGTLLGLGDALLKQGKKRQAKIVYENIRKVPAYPSWPYKDLLDCRLNNMDPLQNKFACDSGRLDVAEPAMLFQSTIACTACHATCR